ncbi:MAG: hypothetical protein PEPC_01488 [Peptostreptococcus russellii]
MEQGTKKKGKGKGCLIAFLIVVLFSFIFSTIADKSDDKKNDKVSEETTKEYKIEEVVKSDKVELTVLNVSEMDSVYDETGFMSYSPDSESNIFLCVDIRIKNIDKSMISLDNSNFKLINKENEYTYSPSTLLIAEGLNLDSINPGTEINTKLYYDIPKDVAEEKLYLKVDDTIFSSIGKFEILLEKENLEVQ